MSTPATAYRKLRGTGWNWSGRARLWLGDDHLLEVHSTAVTEHYRRYFLRDIRALLITPTRFSLWWSIGSGTVLLLCGAAAGALYFFGQAQAEEVERISLWIFAGFFAVGAVLGLISLIVQLLLGPSGACYIETSAGRRRLGAPTRLRPAERLLAELAPLIAAAQEPEP